MAGPGVDSHSVGGIQQAILGAKDDEGSAKGAGGAAKPRAQLADRPTNVEPSASSAASTLPLPRARRRCRGSERTARRPDADSRSRVSPVAAPVSEVARHRSRASRPLPHIQSRVSRWSGHHRADTEGLPVAVRPPGSALVCSRSPRGSTLAPWTRFHHPSLTLRRCPTSSLDSTVCSTRRRPRASWRGWPSSGRRPACELTSPPSRRTRYAALTHGLHPRCMLLAVLYLWLLYRSTPERPRRRCMWFIRIVERPRGRLIVIK